MTMREILFRGKHSEKSRWTYGDLYTDHGKVYIASRDTMQGVRVHGEVIPDTVGQYTGLIDKNGTKIFEGDIVLIPGVGYGVIEYDRACFSLGLVECGLCVSEQSEREILGNIHDNPEMLEGN